MSKRARSTNPLNDAKRARLQTDVYERLKSALKVKGIDSGTREAAATTLSYYHEFKGDMRVSNAAKTMREYRGYFRPLNGAEQCVVCDWACMNTMHERCRVKGLEQEERDRYVVGYHNAVPEELVGAMHPFCGQLALKWATVNPEDVDKLIALTVATLKLKQLQLM